MVNCKWSYKHGNYACNCSSGFKYPNRRYLTQIIVTIPNLETLNALDLGTLDPLGMVIGYLSFYFYLTLDL